MENFLKHKWNFFLQPMLASIFVVLTLIVLGGIKQTDLLGYLGTGSLASSAFLLFCLPNSRSAKITRLLGGYLISLVCGAFFAALIFQLKTLHYDTISFYYADIVAILAMSTSIFGMVIFKLEHPPAVGFTLGLVVETWTEITLLMLFCVVILMAFIKISLRRWLVDLV